MTSSWRSRLWVGVAVFGQLAVLAWMAAGREWILRTGQVVFLRTAPIDPRDPFRGDFVRLQYEINSVRLSPADATAPANHESHKRDEVVYTRLVPSGDGVYEAEEATRTRPVGALFIRGRTNEGWRVGTPMAPAQIAVRYGIEQFYVEQGTGRWIEDRRGTREGIQIPMEVEVAVDKSGTGAIKGYRWSRLGMKLEVTRQAARRNRQQLAAQPAAEGGAQPSPTAATVATEAAAGPLSPALRLTLVNASDAPLTIADTDDHCAFQLRSAGWSDKTYSPAVPPCGQQAAAVRLVTLRPGESYLVDLDLSAPRWHVVSDGQAVEVGALPEFAMFRIEYRTPPSASNTPGLWKGWIHSSRFNGNGIVD